MTHIRPFKDYPSGSVFFAGANLPEHLEEAKRWIRKHNLTSDDVRIVRVDDQILVKRK